MHSFDRELLPPSAYLGRHWCLSCDKIYQAFPLRFCILQPISNWMVGRPGNEAMNGLPRLTERWGSLTTRMSLRPFLAVSVRVPKVSSIREERNLLLTQEEEDMQEMCSFCRPSVYLRKHWHHSFDRMDQAFPQIFASCYKQLKQERGLGIWEWGCLWYPITTALRQ